MLRKIFKLRRVVAAVALVSLMFGITGSAEAWGFHQYLPPAYYATTHCAKGIDSINADQSYHSVAVSAITDSLQDVFCLNAYPRPAYYIEADAVLQIYLSGNWYTTYSDTAYNYSAADYSAYSAAADVNPPAGYVFRVVSGHHVLLNGTDRYHLYIGDLETTF